jgi:putative transposase
VQNRESLFGWVNNEQMALNEYGEIVAACWDDLPRHYANVELDAFVVMPNHIHGIIVLTVGAGLKPAPTLDMANPVTGVGLESNPIHDVVNPITGAGLKPTPTRPVKQYPLSEIVRAFKSFSARRINQQRGTPGRAVWQRDYYEHIIRNEIAYQRIRQYIATNPLEWTQDQLHPNYLSKL